MVSLDEFDRIQQLFGRPQPIQPKTHEFPFTGIIHCGECGCTITAEEHVKRSGRTYVYYRCTKRRRGGCSQKYIAAAILEQRIATFLGELVWPARFHEWAVRLLKRWVEQENGVRALEDRGREDAAASVDRQLQNLTQLRLRDMLSDEDFMRERSRLERERIRLGQRQPVGMRQGGWFEPALMLFYFANYASSWFTDATILEKRLILSVAGSNPILHLREASIDAKKPFRRITPTDDFPELRRGLKSIRTFVTTPEAESTLRMLNELMESRKARERKDAA